jgi:hypothetical protein
MPFPVACLAMLGSVRAEFNSALTEWKWETA